jgi:voltage-gated potassium channel
LLYVVGDATDDQTLLRAAESTAARAQPAVTPRRRRQRVCGALGPAVVRPSGNHRPRWLTPAAEKLERAGANRVVSPYSTGAQRIARFMVNPNLEDFLDFADVRSRTWNW